MRILGKEITMSLLRGPLPLALALTIGLQGAAIAAPAQNTASTAWATTRSLAFQETDASFNGYAADQEPVSIAVTLKLRNQDLLDSYTQELFRPGSPSFHQWMSGEVAKSYFAPTQAQAQAVAAYLTSMGFSNVQIADNRLLVSADGTVGAARRAFRTSIGHFSRNGHSGIANTQDVQVPATLNGLVSHVVGLQTLEQAHVMSRAVTTPLSTIRPNYSTGSSGQHEYLPHEFATVYHAGNLPAATSTGVAIIGWGSMVNAVKDVQKYQSDYGFSAGTVSTVQVGGSSTDDSGQVEWAMDAQAIVGVSGGVKSLTFYTAKSGSTSVLLQTINRAVSDNKAKVINMSWSVSCEDSSTGWADSAFQLGIAQGQTFSNSSGDNGSYPCGASQNGAYGTKTAAVGYPSSSPYVVAVGGTTLNTSTSDSYVSETSWPYSGGGISKYESKPSWQSSLSGSKRQLPDLAFDADWDNSPIAFYLTASSGAGVSANGYYVNGGTSLASPLFVGSWARLESAHGNQLGFAAPAIYQYASSIPLHDVSTGTNGGYSATSGRDNATGWGSFDIQAFSDFISNTPGFITASNP